MKISTPYILFLYIIFSGCSSSVESTVESINNVKSSRYHYIPHLDSYIIVPDNFALISSSGAVDSTTGAFLSWVRKKYTFDYWVSDLDSAIKASIEYHRHTEPSLVETYQRSDLVLNGVRTVLFTCDMYLETAPDKQFTYRLITDRTDSIDEFIGNVVSYRKASVQDSLLFSLRSLIP